MLEPSSPDPHLSSYASPPADPTVIVAAETVSPPPAKVPRVWPVFVAFFAALVGAIVASVLMGIGLLLWIVSEGHAVSKASSLILERLTDPPMFMLAASCSQLAIAVCTIIPAWLSPEGFRQRLRLVTPAVSPAKCVVLVLSVYFPTAIGLAFAHLLVMYLPADETVKKFYEKMTWEWSLPFVLFIALVPGFLEEMLFRGYIQRRLEQRWGPAVAIATASILFALMHMTPQVIVFAFPVGLWFGFIAWRTGSIWPTIAAHAFINGTWNIFNLSMKFEVIPEVSTPAMLIGMAALGLCFFAPSCWILYNAKPASSV